MDLFVYLGFAVLTYPKPETREHQLWETTSQRFSVYTYISCKQNFVA